MKDTQTHTYSSGQPTPRRYPAAHELDEMTRQELYAQRSQLLCEFRSVGPEDIPDALAAALNAVIGEEVARARNYAAHVDKPYLCSCGFRCQSLAAMDGHLDKFPLATDVHCEVSEPGPPRHHVAPHSVITCANTRKRNNDDIEMWRQCSDRPA